MSGPGGWHVRPRHQHFLGRRVDRISLALTLTLTLAFAIFRAAATDTAPGGVANFDCFLTVDETEALPAMTFHYSITGQSVASGDITSETFTVFAGIGQPSIEPVEFKGDETTATSVASGDSISLAQGKKYAKKMANVNFSGVDFPEPGIYRYLITETVTINEKTMILTMLPSGLTLTMTTALLSTRSVRIRRLRTPQRAERAIWTCTSRTAIPSSRFLRMFCIKPLR